jgi:hypothetical protein
MPEQINPRNPSKAIEWLQLSSPYEMGEPQSSFFRIFRSEYISCMNAVKPIFALHQGAEERKLVKANS